MALSFQNYPLALEERWMLDFIDVHCKKLVVRSVKKFC